MDREALIYSYDFLAQIYRSDYRIADALAVYDTIMPLVDTIPDTLLLAQIHFNLGQIQMDVDHEAAKRNLTKAARPNSSNSKKGRCQCQ